MDMTKITCVIPARLQSSRFPRKILADLSGKPLLQWVWEAACRTGYFNKIIIAVDSEETAEVVRGFGGSAEMTPLSCVCGTERLTELVQAGRIEGDIFVNWQGDEPFIDSVMIGDLLQTCRQRDSDIWTLKKKITESSQVLSPHIVKVVTDAQHHALYFSRSPIPYYRDHRPESEKVFYKHIGIYAYTREALLTIARLFLCSIEEAEQLEQLRFLYNGLRICVHETQKEVIGIDLPEHLAAAQAVVEKNFSLQNA
jgi:3-deoxy-manno-octulosonate cytidylyltransferase (CMP-KDO synthetase)